MPVKSLLAAVVGLMMSLPAMAVQPRQPDVDVVIPPEVFTNSNQPQTPPCNQCCIYENKNYSEGAVVKTEGILLQCQRDDKVLGTNPLVWRRVKP
ncbi:YnjH family protein [Klebsiella sp. Ap-873]|uniref:DUF1496 domain-containing protein n=2 Tax=Enterobacterales TaxID=91347 RepID=A0AAN0S5X4_9ENTR|nr:hypothetical protein LH23_14455 [Cedecea neteri]AIR66093.1 hypothetical protein LH86_13635 [Cedecea neteri]NIG73964.1 YnjH family protein [Klebsiella sp. Ap-873]